MSLKSCFYLLGLALTLALSLPAQTVRVLIVNGAAEITPAGATAAHALTKGETVTVGATITTGADGRVVLTPMPGVKSIIAPNTTITLESSTSSKNADATTAYAAVLDVKVGAVVSDLNKPADVTYDYGVRTPRGLAGARGTTFTVGVNPAGIATVVVSHGTIALTFNDGRTASITPGHVSITKPDGTTVEADSLDDLSAEDQAIASNWTEITLDAIADALENGVELAPATLQNVLDTANTLGVELTPAAKATIERIKTKLEAIEKSTQTTSTTNEAKELTTQQKSDYEKAKEAYLATLNSAQVLVFNSELTDTQQRRLVSLSNPNYSTYILNTQRTSGERTYALALNPGPMAVFVGLDGMLQSTLVTANDSTLTTYALTGTRSPTDIYFVANLSPTDRSKFVSLSAPNQALLISENDSQLTSYALSGTHNSADINYFMSLDSTQRTEFLALSSTDQTKLVTANNPSLTAFVLTTGRTSTEISYVLGLTTNQRTAFFNLDPMAQGLLTSAGDAELTTFALSGSRTADEIYFFSALDSTERTKFVALTLTQQTDLVAVNDTDVTTYVLTTGRTAPQINFILALRPIEQPAFLALSSTSQNLLVSQNDPTLTAYALSGMRSDIDIAYYAGLTTDQRTAFDGLRPTYQAQLIGTNSPSLTSYILATGRTGTEIDFVLALDNTQLVAFLGLNSTNQGLLIAADDTSLTDYVLTTGRTLSEISYVLTLEPIDQATFLGFGSTTQTLLVTNNDSELNDYAFDTEAGHTEIGIAFYADLTSPDRADFLKLAIVNQDLLVAINDNVITQIALKGDSDTGLPFTSFDLESNLKAIGLLSPTGLQFLKDSNGPDFESGPGPADWSSAAFDRSAGSWNVLSTAEQNLLLSFGATEAVMDRSATFLNAFIAGVQALPLNQQTAIIETGWGYILFEDYFRDSTFTNTAIATAASLTSTQRAVIKFFDIDPNDLLYGEFNLTDELDKLDALTTPEKELLRKLDLRDNLFYSNSTQLSDAYTRITSLTTDEQNAVIALGMGNYFFNYDAMDSITLSNSTTVTADERISEILTTYLSLSIDQQDALRETELFHNGYNYLGDALFDSTGLADFADEYLALSEQARRFFLTSHDISYIDLYSGYSETGRSLSEVVALVDGLTDAELNTLRDIEGGEILVNALTYEENNEELDMLSTVKAAIAFYDDLTIQQKFTMRELGILQQNDLDWLTTNQIGLDRLLAFYSALSGTLRAGTTYVDYVTPDTTISSDNVFINNRYGVYNVSFSTGKPALYVAAVKELIIQGNDTFNVNPTFATGANGDLYLHAGDLIDLNSVSFSSNIRSITMEAATINLANLDLPAGSTVTLKSLYGSASFTGQSEYGYVNFLYGVTYGGTPIENQGDIDDLMGAITVHTLDGSTPLPPPIGPIFQ